MIAELLSFWNEFIPSPYIFLCNCLHDTERKSFPYDSFRNVFVMVFNPNEILVLVRNLILVSCTLKTNFVADWKSQIVLSGANGACLSDLARKTLRARRLRQSRSIFIMWMEYELHSGTKLIPESLPYFTTSLTRTLRFYRLRPPLKSPLGVKL